MNVTDERSENISAQKQLWDNVFNAMAKLGEYFVDVISVMIRFIGLCFLYLIATIYHGLMHLKKPFESFRSKLGEAFSSPFERHRKVRQLSASEIAAARSEKGFRGALTARLRIIGRAVMGKRGLLATAVNWGLPIVCCVFFINIVSYANNQNYALKLTVNGDFVGYINDETTFATAEKMVQNRINYTGSSTEVFTFEPVYEVEVVGNGVLLNQYQVADKILRLLGREVREGFGLYLGNAFYGTLTSHDRLDAATENILNSYRTGEEKESVQFSQTISYVSGTYLADSFVDEDDIIKQFTSTKNNGTYYTVASGDDLDSVLEKTNMSREQLSSLNPELDGDNDDYEFTEGTRLKTSADEPFLTVIVSREEHYTEEFEYDTTYQDNSLIYAGNKHRLVTGEYGESAVVANISYINGVEVNRRILSRVVTKEPVTEVIEIGTKPRSNTTAPGQFIEEGKMLWPVGGYDGGVLEEPVYWMGGYSGHKGVDISVAFGTPVYAAENGYVVSAVYGGNYDDRGNYIVIQGDSGFTTYYYHNNELFVSAGQRVTAGDMIANVGMTGRTYGPHCHFGVSVGNTWLNPTDYLPWHQRTASYAYRESLYS